MNGMWIEAWMQQSSSDGTVVLFDIMTGDAVVLRAVLVTIGDYQYARLIFFPGDNKQVDLKTWGPITTPGFRSDWHHIALVLRFGHVSAGSSEEPNAILAQAFFFIDCEPINDDGTFTLLDLKSLTLSNGIDSIYVGGASSRASLSARNGYQYFKGRMDNIRVWWPPCPPGPTKCNPYGFLYPQQDYPPYKRVPSSGIQDRDVTIDDVAPILRDSMFADRMPSNTTDLLISLEIDHEDKAGGLLIDTSTWLPESCAAGKEARTACDGCPEDCFFDDCWRFDADCYEPRLSEDHIKFYAENGTCKCLDSLACPKYVEKCECPDAFERVLSANGVEWECACGSRKKTECARCILNGNLQIPSDPCLVPGICRRSACVFPFVKKYDAEHTTGGTTVTINTQIESFELGQFTTEMVGRYLEGPMYEQTKMHILNLMEYSCYAYHSGQLTTEPTVDLQKDKRCNDPATYADGWTDDSSGEVFKCKCIFEDADVSEQTSVRKKIDQYWKSGVDRDFRKDEDLRKAPQMYNLTLALALACKAGKCWEKKRTQRSNVMIEDTSYCPQTKIDPQVFMDNLVGDLNADNQLDEQEFLNQYKLLARLKAVRWDFDPMACTAADENECATMCLDASSSSSGDSADASSTCKCNSIEYLDPEDGTTKEPWEGTCLFSNLEQDESGEPLCAMSDLLLPPAAFFMHLALNDDEAKELGFVGAQRLFAVEFVTKLFDAKYDPDGSGTIDMWELHCYYLEMKDKENTCYPISAAEAAAAGYDSEGGYDGAAAVATEAGTEYAYGDSYADPYSMYGYGDSYGAFECCTPWWYTAYVKSSMLPDMILPCHLVCCLSTTRHAHTRVPRERPCRSLWSAFAFASGYGMYGGYGGYYGGV